MAKRFFETALLDEDWYLIMPTEYKLFWQWIILKCDHAGFFRPNVELFNRFNGVQIDLKQATSYFNSEPDKPKVRILLNGIWFIEKFISFQYGSTLNQYNRLHNSIIDICKRNNIELTSIRGLLEVKLTSTRPVVEETEGLKDKDKDKDKEKNNKGGMGEKEFRKQEFKKTVMDFESQYSESMKLEFFEYWTESSQGGKKLRFEMEKVFDLGRRLGTWAKNNKTGFSKTPERTPSKKIQTEKYGLLDELTYNQLVQKGEL